MKFTFWSFIRTNFSYKIVSLFIAIVLWILILGRRDFILTRNIEVEFITGSENQITAQSVDQLKVKVSGPKTAIRKFMESNLSQLITLDITKKGVGDFTVNVPIQRIDVPLGLKVHSVKPSQIRVKVEKKE